MSEASPEPNPYAPPTGWVPPPPGWAPPPPGWAPPGQPGWAPPPPPGWAPPPYGWAPPGQPVWGPPPAYPWLPVRPPRRGLGTKGIALLTVILVLVVGGTGVAIDRRDAIEQRRIARLRAQVRAELPALQRFVEQERGLTFTEPVDVVLLDDDEFLARINEGGEEVSGVDDDDLPAYDPPSTLLALGLIDSIEDYYEAAGAAIDDSVQGFYEFKSKQLVIRGRALNPLTRLVLVHELTHALQDQHFDLSAHDFSTTSDEQEVAFTALVEGDANRVDAAYRESLPAGERRELERIENELYAGIGFDGPEVIYTLLGFPYAVGPEFVLGVLEAGRQPALDAAFRTPPTTTEQILHPDEYVAAAEPATTVAQPGAPGKLLDEGVLGELGLIVVLGDGSNDPAGTPPVLGWAGDAYVTYESGDEVCIRALVRMETPKDRDELHRALEEWADSRADVARVGEIDLTLERCSF